MSRVTKPLWITYSWPDDAEGDFGFLVQELKSVGVEARYDRVASSPAADSGTRSAIKSNLGGPRQVPKTNCSRVVIVGRLAACEASTPESPGMSRFAFVLLPRAQIRAGV